MMKQGISEDSRAFPPEVKICFLFSVIARKVATFPLGKNVFQLRHRNTVQAVVKEKEEKLYTVPH